MGEHTGLCSRLVLHGCVGGKVSLYGISHLPRPTVPCAIWEVVEEGFPTKWGSHLPCVVCVTAGLYAHRHHTHPLTTGALQNGQNGQNGAKRCKTGAKRCKTVQNGAKWVQNGCKMGANCLNGQKRRWGNGTWANWQMANGKWAHCNTMDIISFEYAAVMRHPRRR